MKKKEAEKLIEGFENGTWPKEQWSHLAHFVMALWYCYHLPFPVAVEQIKQGIKKYNVSTGGQNTEDSGYHETITVFYIQAIYHFLLNKMPESNFENLLVNLEKQSFIAKDFPFRFYSKELLMGREARKSWIAPDKQPFCFR